MAIALPCTSGLFSPMKEALIHVYGKRVALTRGIHQALADFRWLAEDLGQLTTRLYELVPLQTTLDAITMHMGVCVEGQYSGDPLRCPEPPTAF